MKPGTRLPVGLALAAGLLGLVLALWPAVNGSRQYSPTVAVTLVTGWAVIAYTCISYLALQETRTRDERERERVRDSLSAALASELKRLDGRMEEFGDDWFYWGTTSRQPIAPVLRAALDRVDLFEPREASHMAELHEIVVMLRWLADELPKHAPESEKGMALYDHFTTEIQAGRTLAIHLRRSLEK